MAVAALTYALSGLPAQETTTAHAVGLPTLANAWARVNDPVAAGAMARWAVAAAQVCGAEQHEADARIMLGAITARLGDHETGLALVRAGIERAVSWRLRVHRVARCDIDETDGWACSSAAAPKRSTWPPRGPPWPSGPATAAALAPSWPATGWSR